MRLPQRSGGGQRSITEYPLSRDISDLRRNRKILRCASDRNMRRGLSLRPVIEDDMNFDV